MAWRAGCRVSQHGIHAIPPDLPLQSRGQEFPDHRGGARRGRASSSNPETGAPLHARLRRARRACAARHRRPRHRPRDQARRPRLRPPRHQPPRARVRAARTSPTSTRSCSGSASTSRRSRSRSCRRSITPAAACWSTSTAAPTCRASMRPAKSPSRACTAPTAWPPTRLLECFVFGEAAAQAHPRAAGTSSPEPPAIRGVGRKPGHRQRRGSRHPADTGARSAASCGTSSASSAPPSGSSAPSTASTCCARRSTDYYRHFRVTADLIELRNLVEVADLIVRSRAEPPRKPRPALHARLSRDAAEAVRHGAGAMTGGRR